MSSEPTSTMKTKHPKVHVLLVNLQFSSAADLKTWCGEFQALADTVYATEPNCLSYEVCYDNQDDSKMIIYERYKSLADLEGPHQSTLATFRESFKHSVEPTSVSLTHYTESNIGHMDR